MHFLTAPISAMSFGKNQTGKKSVSTHYWYELVSFRSWPVYLFIYLSYSVYTLGWGNSIPLFKWKLSKFIRLHRTSSVWNVENKFQNWCHVISYSSSFVCIFFRCFHFHSYSIFAKVKMLTSQEKWSFRSNFFNAFRVLFALNISRSSKWLILRQWKCVLFPCFIVIIDWSQRNFIANESLCVKLLVKLATRYLNVSLINCSVKRIKLQHISQNEIETWASNAVILLEYHKLNGTSRLRNK